MAEGFGSAGANTALDALLTAYPWLKLHVGAPGAAGTSAPATETTRKQVTWNASAAGHADNSNALNWSTVAGSEDYTHFTLWTASTAGNFGASGQITANPVASGDNFAIAIGDLDMTLPLAS